MAFPARRAEKFLLIFLSTLLICRQSYACRKAQLLALHMSRRRCNKQQRRKNSFSRITFQSVMEAGRELCRPEAAGFWDSTQLFQKSITIEVKPVNILKKKLKIARLGDKVCAPILCSFPTLLNHLHWTKKETQRQKLPGTLRPRWEGLALEAFPASSFSTSWGETFRLHLQGPLPGIHLPLKLFWSEPFSFLT